MCVCVCVCVCACVCVCINIYVYIYIYISIYLFKKQILKKFFLACVFYQFGTFYHLKLLNLMFDLHLHIA